ncbi:leucine-rich repeat-containing protein 43 [Sarcophilus harrisii]
METEQGPVTVSKTFHEHLRQLGLHEFPCGVGSWNRTRFSSQNLKSWKGSIPKMPDDVPPEEETVSALLRLVQSRKSPWTHPKDATMEDQYLRELAIHNPLIIEDDFLFSYFTSLRVVDKGVTLIDEDLLKFLKLEELILSANRIKEVDPMNLPPTLKVLELYGNQMTSIQCLCSHPPPALQHLGVGHNNLLGYLESHYITATYWPNLVSLDLGYNDLTELRFMIAGLCTLSQLRLLVLQGNPLALVPHYRGYTVDCLPQLNVLDDITVSPEERHLFQGLSCKLGAEPAKLHLMGARPPASTATGDPQGSKLGAFGASPRLGKCPFQLKPPLALALAEEKAYLTVTLKKVSGVLDSSVLDEEPELEGPYIAYSYYVTYNFVEDEKDAGKEFASNMDETAGWAVDLLDPDLSPVSPRNQPMASDDVMKSTESPLLSTVLSSEENNEPEADPRLNPAPGSVLFSTIQKPWSNVIEYNYKMKHTLKDLIPLKAFLLLGTNITIVEEKLRKKDSPKEFRHDPPILRVLGSQLLNLEPLLSGETLVTSLCNFGTVRTAETDKLTWIKSSLGSKPWNGRARKNLRECERWNRPENMGCQTLKELTQGADSWHSG